MKLQRILRAALAGALAASTLASCAAGRDYSGLLDRNAPVTITVWHYYNGVQQAQFDAMIDEFDSTVGSELGIVVEAFSKNSVGELSSSVVSSLNQEPGAEAPPDIFAAYAETAYQLDKTGVLVDLSRYFTREELDEYVEEYIAEGAFGGEGTLKIFPTAKSTEVMMLNLTDWERFAQAQGLTYEDLSTWEGLAAAAEQYYHYTDGLTPGVPNDGRALFGRDAVANYMIIGAMQLGHPFASQGEDGAVAVGVHKQTMRKLWDCFYAPYVKGFFLAENRFRSDDAKIGSIIAMVCSTTGAVYFPEEVTIGDEYSYPIQGAVLPVPNFEGCAPCVVQQGAGMSVIRSDEKTQYACAVFLKWFTERQRNIGFCVRSGYLPVTKAANDFEAIAADAGSAHISGAALEALRVAVDEVNTYSLYTSPPFGQSAQMRDYLAQALEGGAQEARQAAQARIAAGEDRDAVWEEYTGGEAFERWFAQFEAGFQQLTGE